MDQSLYRSHVSTAPCEFQWHLKAVDMCTNVWSLAHWACRGLHMSDKYRLRILHIKFICPFGNQELSWTTNVGPAHYCAIKLMTFRLYLQHYFHVPIGFVKRCFIGKVMDFCKCCITTNDRYTSLHYFHVPIGPVKRCFIGKVMDFCKCCITTNDRYTSLHVLFNRIWTENISPATAVLLWLLKRIIKTEVFLNRLCSAYV